ncbi:MAG: DNA gyrase/topoisomerase IV subunit A [Saprospiraceae bacterium]|nr:DNA gyrase/topoisomerase IV subunit A [Saprospiraceae bacterium]
MTTSREDNLQTLTGMYEEYFLDYASYVILERAVPAIEDGLKPVQRRILHAMREMEDGRYHKVANIIGQTMQYHPHGDAAIGDALVNLGQRDLLVDPQGNWGDVRTGDGAAAARYIEARLTPFALEVLFNPQTTEWQLSYDGRKREPVTLPAKFPVLLAQGVEGIAVGLSTRLLPHNFLELIDASIDLLRHKKVELYPDFDTGGMVDVTEYQQGERGGRVKVRATIEIPDKKNLVIRELPYGVTTGALIDTIVKANDKGKIKIKRIIDNTAEHVEIQLELQPGISPEVTVDALYAFTSCEVSLSPNACVILDDKPHFLNVVDILKYNTHQTRTLLGRELEIRQDELEEQWHFASLEKIFIENRIYRDIEECETWEEVLTAIDTGLRRFVLTPGMKEKPGDKRVRLLRDLTQEDLARLTEIRIKRISRYNSFKADEQIARTEAELEQVKHDLAHLTDYTIAWFKRLKEKYGKGKERRTRICSFETIEAREVVAVNAKLYVNRKDGFIGTGLKKDEFVCDCSDIDDIITFRKNGTFSVNRIGEKVFVGKDILHVGVWSKKDDRTIYHMVYWDGKTGVCFAKRFNVTAITRDKEYDLTKGSPNSRCLYFSAHPNGEAEVVQVSLSPNSRARIKEFEFDFGEMAIKGRTSQGNILTKYPVKRIVRKGVGKSTLGAKQVWLDPVSGRLNAEERGQFLGAFDTGDQILALYRDGSYAVTEFDLSNRYEAEELLEVRKFDPTAIMSAVYYDGHKGWTVVKRFVIETTTTGQRFSYITDHKASKLYLVTVFPDPEVEYKYVDGKKVLQHEIALISDIVDIKGWKALGNLLVKFPLREIRLTTEQADPREGEKPASSYHPGDTVEFDVDGRQGELFGDGE